MERLVKRGKKAATDAEEYILDEEEELLKADSEENILAKEAQLLKANIDSNIDAEIDSLFKFAVTRHTRRVTPDPEKFTKERKLKGYQEEGLGWMLDREGYRAPPAEIMPSTWTSRGLGPEKTWTNTTTGITISQPPIEPSLLPYMGPPSTDIVKLINSVHGGLLADEMGLGKTVQMIALIVTHIAPERLLSSNETNATLVVVPPILLGTWQSELKSWAPGLKVYVHYGRPEERSANISPFKEHDVVLTTYDTLKTDEAQLKLFTKLKWWRIILDEAHKINNAKTLVAKTMHSLEATNRWAMTGTPIQNSWGDMFSLLKFLRVRPYGEMQGWYRLIEQPLRAEKSDFKKEALENLRNLVQVLVLRRTKQTQIDVKLLPPLSLGLVVKLRSPPPVEDTDWKQTGEEEFWEIIEKNFKNYVLENLLNKRIKVTQPYLENGLPTWLPIQELVHIPKKKIEIVELSFTKKEEKDKYTTLVEEARVEEETTVQNVLEFLLRLRQAAIHPWLLLGRAKLDERITAVNTKKMPWQNSTKIEYLVEDLRATKAGGTRETEKSLVFSQFTGALDLLQIALWLDGWMPEDIWQERRRTYKPRDFEKYRNTPRYVRIDGTKSQIQREAAMASLKDKPNVKLALLSLHSAGVGLNLISANNVYFMDQFFNPQVHSQAIDRTHRIGQEKVVTVKTIIIKGTVEEKLMELLDYKTRISETTLKPIKVERDKILSLLK